MLFIDGASRIGSNGVLVLKSGTIDGPLTNQGLMLVQGNSAINSAPGEFTNGPGTTLRLEGSITTAYAQLTIANGLANGGTIELDTSYATYYPSLTVTNGTLVNTNLIDVQATAAGNRYLYAEIDNQGTIDLAAATTINRAGAVDHTNSGTINVNGGDLTCSLSADTFTNSGELNIADGMQLYLNGGTFSNFVAGVLTGGTYDVAGTFRFTGADIVTNAATIVLDGPASQIVDQSNNDALANFATNAAGGSFTITNGRDLTTPGALSNAGEVIVGIDGMLAVSGSYTQTGGSTTLEDTTSVLDPSDLADIQGGSLDGNGTLDGNVANAGLTSPGLSAGLLYVTGTYDQTGVGELDIEIGGLTPETEYDVLAMDGAATLAGALTVTLIDEFEPPVGATFDILPAISLDGRFDPENLPTLASGNCWGVVYGATAVTLTVLGPPRSRSRRSVRSYVMDIQ